MGEFRIEYVDCGMYGDDEDHEIAGFEEISGEESADV